MTPAGHLMVAGGGDATDYFFIGRSWPTLSRNFTLRSRLGSVAVTREAAVDRPSGSVAPMVVAQLFLGENLLAWLVLALGGALAVGTAVALVRPPGSPTEGDLVRPPLARSLVMIAVGAIAALWALASLVAG